MNIRKLLLVFTIISFVSCGVKETPLALGKEWCDQSKKIEKAKSYEDKYLAIKARDRILDLLEKKYKYDDKFMEAFEKEIAKCAGF